MSEERDTAVMGMGGSHQASHQHLNGGAPHGMGSHLPHRSHDIPSLLNPDRSQDSKIDPALRSLGVSTGMTATTPAPIPPGAQTDRDPDADSRAEKARRKERLLREREAMRAELARKERELEELDD